MVSPPCCGLRAASLQIDEDGVCGRIEGSGGLGFPCLEYPGENNAENDERHSETAQKVRMPTQIWKLGISMENSLKSRGSKTCRLLFVIASFFSSSLDRGM